jgi:selenoprotein W-related protein
MVSGLLGEFEHKIDGITLIPSRGGVFEVMADDKLIYSKKETGEHAEYEDAAAPLRELIG